MRGVQLMANIKCTKFPITQYICNKFKFELPVQIFHKVRHQALDSMVPVHSTIQLSDKKRENFLQYNTENWEI